MYDRQQLLILSITTTGVWLNLYNTIKTRNDYKKPKSESKRTSLEGNKYYWPFVV